MLLAPGSLHWFMITNRNKLNFNPPSVLLTEVLQSSQSPSQRVLHRPFSQQSNWAVSAAVIYDVNVGCVPFSFACFSGPASSNVRY